MPNIADPIVHPDPSLTVPAYVLRPPLLLLGCATGPKSRLLVGVPVHANETIRLFQGAVSTGMLRHAHLLCASA
jgi:hypothetical protein